LELENTVKVKQTVVASGLRGGKSFHSRPGYDNCEMFLLLAKFIIFLSDWTVLSALFTNSPKNEQKEENSSSLARCHLTTHKNLRTKFSAIKIAIN